MRDKIKMISPDGKHFRTTTKNKKKTPTKLKMKKYNPQTRRHEEYEEGKIK